MKITNDMLGRKIRKTGWGKGYFVIARYATDARVATEDNKGELKIYDNEDCLCSWEFYTEPVEEKRPSERIAEILEGDLVETDAAIILVLDDLWESGALRPCKGEEEK